MTRVWLLRTPPYLLTTRIIHELDLDSLRADNGKARFQLREHAQRFCELFVDLRDTRT